MHYCVAINHLSIAKGNLSVNGIQMKSKAKEQNLPIDDNQTISRAPVGLSTRRDVCGKIVLF